MLTGTLVENATGFALSISSMTFDLNGLVVRPNPYKKADNHPDYQVEYRTPRGNMMRVGSMWKAKSERSGAEYYSITLTDKNGKTWRMNAVRNETLREGEWTVVPLAGGEPERIMVTGSLEMTEDDAIVATIESYDFAISVIGIASETKSEDNHPDYHLEVKSPSGATIRIGSAWKATSQNGNDYFSLAFWSPHGTNHRANAVKDVDSDGKFRIIPLTEAKESESAFA